VTQRTREAVRAGAERVLRAGWREGRRRDGTPYGFTCPAPRKYVHQWYWDSCFHAIAWRHFDAERAKEELRTLVRAMSPAGLVPHTVFWGGRARWRRAPFYATESAFGALATAHTQTPMLALAWELVAGDDAAFAAEGAAALPAHYDWLDRERDPDGDGLVSILFPDESGLDDSPKYDQVYGRMAHYRPGYFWLVQRHRRAGYSASAIADRSDHHVEDVLVNTFYALSLRALHRLGGGERFLERARRAERALMERCWDEELGLFLDLAERSERPVRVSTWSSLAPLALRAIPEAVRRRLVEEHLLDPRRYRSPVGIPSVSREEPSFRPGFDRFRCWRGPSWVNSAWLLVPPLRELGYEEEAERVAGSLAAAVEAEGFREYYNPLTGRGLGARDFGWSTLVVDL
jgi:glycogen debranching enzyme